MDLRETYAGKRVLVTGHTGFKGSWLTIWLNALDATVTGYALAPGDERELFRRAGVDSLCRNIEGDVRRLDTLEAVVRELRPEFVFHLAAQSLVRRSYRNPAETFDTNVVGTVNILEAIRRTGSRCAVVVVTSDKCYENDGRETEYREDDRLGGRDPYSASKGAAEIATASYRASFFPVARLEEHGVAIATARSGNVVGGGDWCEDRLIPDAIRALESGSPVSVRNSRSVRPWQHVLDPLSGYLLLAARLHADKPAMRASFCEAWNFGPTSANSRTVSDVVEEALRQWGSGSWVDASDPTAPHEAAHLTLSIEKARTRIPWLPKWGLEQSIARTIDWYRCAATAAGTAELAELCRRQIAEHSS